jgi:type IV pilus assembly protein PilY1
VLVGALGGGGQGIYALDVTDPSTFSESNTKTVMWEFNDTDDNVSTDPSYAPGGLGYVFSQPVIRKMSNGRWAAIVSGGYNNSEIDGPATTKGSGIGYIYILFLEGPTGGANGRTWIHGTDYIRLDTGVGTVATPNGLAQPFAADVDSDGYIDFIYAGDLRGNFWKFDVTGSTSAGLPGKKDPKSWLGTNNRVALYTGVQPITAQAEGTIHPTGKGFMLLFGTGKYLEASDSIAPYQTQSFYGIWDKNDAPGKITGQTKVAGNSTLFRQLISASGNYRVLTPEKGTVPDWTTNMGWFMDFPNSTTTGERSVFDPLLVGGRLIFTTLLPSGGACEFGGTSFVMVVNPATGGRFDGAVLDVNGDGLITPADTLSGGVYASGVQSAVGITPTPTVIGSRSGGASSSAIVTADGTTLVRNRSSVRGNMIFGGSGGNGEAVTLPIGLAKEYGRVSWREVLKK